MRILVCWKLDGLHCSRHFEDKGAAETFVNRVRARGARDVYVYGG